VGIVGGGGFLGLRSYSAMILNDDIEERIIIVRSGGATAIAIVQVRNISPARD